jgi:hypothetical protein
MIVEGHLNPYRYLYRSIYDRSEEERLKAWFLVLKSAIRCYCMRFLSGETHSDPQVAFLVFKCTN